MDHAVKERYAGAAAGRSSSDAHNYKIAITGAFKSPNRDVVINPAVMRVLVSSTEH